MPTAIIQTLVYQENAVYDDQTTFKTRVRQFWEWFTVVADDFCNQIEMGEGPEIEPEVTKAIARWLPGFSYVFGPGDHGGHSFTLSPGGNIDLRFLAAYWLSQAPQVDGWTFYSSRQPGLSDGFGIRIADSDFDAEDVIISFKVNEEYEVLDVEFWHPNFVDDEDINHQVAFIFLDEALGETGTEMWVGNITLAEEEPKDGVPLKSLASEVVSAASMHDWDKSPPEKTFTGYTVPDPKDGYPRSDTIAGSTCHFPLVGEFMEREGILDRDPLQGIGAQFLYLSIDASDFPENDEVSYRAQIEDNLEGLLQEKESGQVLGGATGFRNAYIDLVVFDGENSLDLIEQSMQLQNLTGKYRIEPFFTSQSL